MWGGAESRLLTCMNLALNLEFPSQHALLVCYRTGSDSDLGGVGLGGGCCPRTAGGSQAEDSVKFRGGEFRPRSGFSGTECGALRIEAAFLSIEGQ